MSNALLLATVIAWHLGVNWTAAVSLAVSCSWTLLLPCSLSAEVHCFIGNQLVTNSSTSHLMFSGSLLIDVYWFYKYLSPMYKLSLPSNLQGEVGSICQSYWILYLGSFKWVPWSIWNSTVPFKSAVLQTNCSNSSPSYLPSYQDKSFSLVRIATCATERATW